MDVWEEALLRLPVYFYLLLVGLPTLKPSPLIALTAGSHQPDAGFPPLPLKILGSALKIEYLWGCPKRLVNASARAEALSRLLRLTAFLVAHGGGLNLAAGAAGAAAASASLPEYRELSAVRPLLATFRHAAHAVLSTDGLDLDGSLTMLDALRFALRQLLLCSPFHGHGRQLLEDGDASPTVMPDHWAAVVMCLELLPAACSVGSWGLKKGNYCYAGSMFLNLDIMGRIASSFASG